MEEVSKFPKMVSDPMATPFDPNFHFHGRALAINVRAKFQISSFYRCRDMKGVPKFPKMLT